MEKMTYVQAINSAIDMFAQGGQIDPEDKAVVEKLIALRTSLEKRKATARKGLTKVQKENVGIKADILAVLEERGVLTATAVGEALGISCQKASALLKQMVDNGEVVKAKDGKATVFSAVADTDEAE